MKKDKYVCPYCNEEFPTSYPSKTIIDDWRHNAQLAKANFDKHVKACRSRDLIDDVNELEELIHKAEK